MLKKLKEYFKSKQELQKEKERVELALSVANDKLKSKVWISLPSIKELEQEKLYYMQFGEEITELEMSKARFVLREFLSNLQWTPPVILVINKPIKECSKAELEMLAKEYRRQIKDRGEKSV